MRTILSSLALCALVSTLAAADPRPPLPVLTIAHAEATPKLDADPADPAWAKAPALPGLGLTIGADPGDEALPTEVRLLWDAQFLYVRFTCRQTGIDAPFASRDQPHYKADVVEVFLDPVGDGRQYFEIEVSPKNQIFDALFTLTTEPRANENGRLLPDVINRNLWNSVDWNCESLRTATRLQTTATGETTGWVADLALPAAPLLRRLGLTKFEPLTLRAHLLRYHWTEPYADPAPPSRRLIAMSWATVEKGCPHISPGAMGFLKLER